MTRLLLTALLCAVSVAGLAQQPEAKQQQPSAEDQLTFVRLRGRLVDARAREQAALRALSDAQKDIVDLEPKYNAHLNTMTAKLPPPMKGKIWQPQDDGNFGLRFIEVEPPVASAPAPVTVPPTAADKPEKSAGKPKQ